MPVLENFTPPAVAVSLVYPQNRLISPKVRAFVDFATPRLRTALNKLTVLIAGPPFASSTGSTPD